MNRLYLLQISNSDDEDSEYKPVAKKPKLQTKKKMKRDVENTESTDGSEATPTKPKLQAKKKTKSDVGNTQSIDDSEATPTKKPKLQTKKKTKSDVGNTQSLESTDGSEATPTTVSKNSTDWSKVDLSTVTEKDGRYVTMCI